MDTEHTTKSFHAYEPDFYLTCVGWVDNEGGEGIEWFDHAETESGGKQSLETLQDVIDKADLLVAHHGKHDVNVLRSYGLNFENVQLHCTMVSEYILRGQDKERRWSLNDVADYYGLGQKHDVVKEGYWDRGIDTYDIPKYILGPYCLQDCHLTMQIYEKQAAQMEGRQIKKVIDLHNEFLLCLSDMELNGLKIDTEVADAIIEKYSEKAKMYADKIKELAGEPRLNVGSPSQLSAVLFGGKLKLKWREWEIDECKTKPWSYYRHKQYTEEVDYEGLGFKPDPKTQRNDGYYKTDKTTLATLKANTKRKRDIKRLLISYSENAKVVETLRGRKGNTGLLTKIQPDGLVHPKLNQAVAATGRLTSSDPNGQNLPRGNTSPIKKCFVPTLDGIMQVDLSQVEWRAAGWLSQDQVMIQEVNSGVDQHVATVRELMEMEFKDKSDPQSKSNRDHAKVFNFRMIYGGTEWGFHLDINMPAFGIKKWKKVIESFFKKYFGLKQYHNECIKFVMRHGYLELPTGRWFKFHKNTWSEGVRTYKVNQIKNFPVQGISGGDILPLMCVVIRRGMKKMGMKSKLILTVHDSIVFDYAEDERDKLIRLCYNVGNNLDKYIESYFGLKWNVKLECEVEVGPNYGELREIKPKEVGL